MKVYKLKRNNNMARGNSHANNSSDDRQNSRLIRRAMDAEGSDQSVTTTTIRLMIGNVNRMEDIKNNGTRRKAILRRDRRSMGSRIPTTGRASLADINGSRRRRRRENSNRTSTNPNRSTLLTTVFTRVLHARNHGRSKERRTSRTGNNDGARITSRSTIRRHISSNLTTCLLYRLVKDIKNSMTLRKLIILRRLGGVHDFRQLIFFTNTLRIFKLVMNKSANTSSRNTSTNGSRRSNTSHTRRVLVGNTTALKRSSNMSRRARTRKRRMIRHDTPSASNKALTKVINRSDQRNLNNRINSNVTSSMGGMNRGRRQRTRTLTKTRIRRARRTSDLSRMTTSRGGARLTRANISTIMSRHRRQINGTIRGTNRRRSRASNYDNSTMTSTNEVANRASRKVSTRTRGNITNMTSSLPRFYATMLSTICFANAKFLLRRGSFPPFYIGKIPLFLAPRWRGTATATK